jgi:predicted small metal-binding protein
MNRSAVADRKEHDMSRKVADCRDFPSQTNCTLTISGEEDEVLTAAAQHAESVHGHQDTSEVRAWLRENLKDELPAGP